LVKEYIDSKYKNEDLIDQVFHSKENLGKINAILAVSSGCKEPLITVTDADVLFKCKWQSAVENLFLGFNEAGMVSPVPSSKSFKVFVKSTWYYGVFKGKIRFKDVKDPLGLKRFDESLGCVKPIYDDIHLEKYLTISNKKVEAVVGCGHFVATYRREVFDNGNSQPAFSKMGGVVMNDFIDKPNDDLGYLRLATKENYAFHLGNTVEQWMHEELIQSKKCMESPLDPILFTKFSNLNSFQNTIGKFISRLIGIPLFRKIYFRLIGLTKMAAENY
jgi:hypothetical protein